MRKFLTGFLAIGIAAASMATPAFAQYGMDRNGPKNTLTPDLPHCDRPLGRAAIKEPENRWWLQYNLSRPEVLLKLFADRQLRIGPEIVSFLLPRMERSFDAVRALVAAIDGAALSGQRPVTIPLLRQVLGNGAASSGDG